MSHTFEVRVDAAMMRQAWNAWFFRGQRFWRLGIAVALLLGGAALDRRSNHLSTISIVGLTVLGFGLVIFVRSYFVGLRRSLDTLEAIVDGKATYTLTDSTIEAVSSMGSVSLAWSSVAELRRYEGLILLGFRGAMYSTIPYSQITPEALAFLSERSRTAGAQLIGL
jgi:hypothetical protein